MRAGEWNEPLPAFFSKISCFSARFFSVFSALDFPTFFLYNSSLMENNSVQKDSVQVENKMGTMGVGRLLISMSVPMSLSMLVQALYNIVDSIF